MFAWKTSWAAGAAVVVLIAGMLGAAARVAVAAAPGSRMRIAVMPFEYSAVGDSWGQPGLDIGAGMADMLVTELVRTNAFTVVEREQLAKILSEQDLGRSRSFDPATVARLGRLVGVEALLFGSVTRFDVERTTGTVQTGGAYRGVDGMRTDRQVARVGIDVKLVDVETGIVLSVASAMGEDTRKLNLPRWTYYETHRLGFGDISRDLVGAAAERAVVGIIGQLTEAPMDEAGSGSSALIADLDGVSVTINAGSANGIQPGDKLVVETLVREVRDPANEAVILRRICRPIAHLTVTESDQKYSIAVVDSILGSAVLKVGQEVRPVER